MRSLYVGEALNAITGLPPTSENYHHAIEILQSRFGKKDVMITSHMDEILKISAISEGGNTRQAFDKMQVHIRALESLGVESKSFGPLLAPVINSQLPKELHLIVSRELKSPENALKLDDLIRVLMEEIEARELSGFASGIKKDSRDDDTR